MPVEWLDMLEIRDLEFDPAATEDSTAEGEEGVQLRVMTLEASTRMALMEHRLERAGLA